MRSIKHGYHIMFVITTSGFLLFAVFLLMSYTSPSAHAMASNLFVKPGASGSCTQAQPCDLQTALDLAVGGDTIVAAHGTYTGTGTAVITITKSITLAGGWDGADGMEVVRHPSRFPSILDGERARRVIFISGNITPTIDGVTIVNGNATGLGLSGCPSNADGCGGGIFSSYNAHPIIVNNTITNNIAAITTSGFPTRTTGYGGGLFLAGGVNALIENSAIISNAGSIANWGNGGGIYFWGPNFNGMQVLSNQILSNSATTQNEPGYGGGIWGAPDNSLFRNNIFRGNRQGQTKNFGSGAAIYQYGGNAYLLNNMMQDNFGGNVVHLRYSCSVFDGNIILDNDVFTGIQVWDSAGGSSKLGCPSLVNNVIARSGDYGIKIETPFSRITSTLINNTLIGSDTDTGISLDGNVTAYITNTIVSGFNWGITTTTPVSTSFSVDHTLFWANNNDGIRGANPVDGDPTFASDGYHLLPGSSAIDAGISMGLFTDIDGDQRQLGAAVDIGADEWGIPIFLPVIIRN